MKKIMQVLKGSSEVAKALNKLLDNSGERIIAVAYVGDNAINYLPNPEGLLIYCSTEIPGTNPYSLRTLKNAGIELHEVKNLHSKIYWSEHKGVVIGSANLSNNGLSIKGNHEVAVLIPSDEFDMHSYINGLYSTPITFKQLDILEKKYNLYVLRNKIKKKATRTKENGFVDWYEQNGPTWRLYPWSEDGDLPRDVKTSLYSDHPTINTYDFMQSSNPNAYELGGLVLSVKENWVNDELESVSEYSWFIPEIMIKSEQKNASEFPYYWISINRSTPHHIPFDVNDKVFSASFNKGYLDYTQGSKSLVLKSNVPSKEFLGKVYENIKLQLTKPSSGRAKGALR